MDTPAPLSPVPDKDLQDGDGHHCNTVEETYTSLVVDPFSVEGQGHMEREKTCKARCSTIFYPCMQSHHLLPTNPTQLQKLRYAFLCPPHGRNVKHFWELLKYTTLIIYLWQYHNRDVLPLHKADAGLEPGKRLATGLPFPERIGKWLTGLLIILLVFGSLVSLLGEVALPGGNIFSLFILFLGAEAAGRLVVPLKLPPLLGMLVVGILLKSVPGIDHVGKNIDQEWSAALRNLALVIILLRAGLGLDPAALNKLSFMVVRLAFCPCLVETLVVAVVTHFLLGFPWLWGLMLGFVLGAVTPAVIVPCMLVLSQKGYGVDKGIPTLVIAASSVDDVLAISGFGVLMGITFAEGELWVVILKGPFEVVVGVVYGLVLGILCWVLPVPTEHNAPVLRFVVLLAAGIVSLFGSPLIHLGGSGALGCLVMAFVAGYGWRKQGMTEENYVDKMLERMWMFFQPFLFALIGAEIQVDKLEGSTIGYGFLTLLVSLAFRMVTSFLVVMGGELNIRERIFVAFAWLPKATVQAAIGSQALDYARKTNAGPEEERLGEQVLTIAVLSILLTAPVGAAAIMLTAPRLLGKSVQANEEVIDAAKEATE